jgi:hypothetical protein
MISRLSTLLVLAALCGLCRAQDAEFVIVTPAGLSPAGAVATVAQLASNVVALVAADAALQATSNAVAEVAALVDGVRAVVNGVEGVGYIQGFMLDFGVSGVEPNTNVIATVVYFAPAVSNDATYTYSDLYTYFSEEPAEFPVVRWSASPRDDPAWTELESVAVVATNVLVGATLYDCFRNTVAVPNEQTNSFFRIFAETQQQQTGAFLPVRNGIKVGNEIPLSVELTEGTNTWRIVGGVFCELPE